MSRCYELDCLSDTKQNFSSQNIFVFTRGIWYARDIKASGDAIEFLDILLI
jgi:hypothetical protein